MTPPEASANPVSVPDNVVVASVVVVSRQRPDLLARCLRSLSQQDHPQFEVIVVADPAGLAAADATGIVLKRVAYDEANISIARNLGLALATAPVVAFIDDDAAAEPTWLSRLTTPFSNPDVVAATGYVRGRNGISYQWRASEVDVRAQDHDLAVPDAGALLPARSGRAVKTVGTNCAFRTGTLRHIGGFDAGYRFYLDDADVNLRLGPMGLTAVVPMAQVHHAYAASRHRRADRTPQTLHDIAASTAVFLRRHAPAEIEAGLLRLTAQQQQRLAGFAKGGRLTVRQVQTLMISLTQGWQEGLARPLTEFAPLADTRSPFLPIPGTGPRIHHIVAGHRLFRARLVRQARALARDGIVTVYCFSTIPWRHHMRYDPAGFWMQEGGVTARSLRDGPAFRFCSLSARIREENMYWANYRHDGR